MPKTNDNAPGSKPARPRRSADGQSLIFLSTQKPDGSWRGATEDEAKACDARIAAGACDALPEGGDA